jgi:outer membrane protein assembly factor BamB
MTRKLVVSFALCWVSCLSAADWPCWRGPERNGISPETGLNWNWGEQGPAVLWRASLGKGFSAFAVADGRAYTLGNRDDVDTVFCLDAVTGKELWRHSYACPLDPLSYEGGPSATPAVDNGRVYTLSKSGHAFCLDARTGEVVWARTFAAPPTTRADYRVWWGFAGSPLVLSDRVILAVGTGGRALAKATGETLWESPDGRPGYSSPVPFRQGDRSAFALINGHEVVAADFATGERLWQIPWRTTWDQNAPDVLVADGQLLVSTGHGVGCALFDLTSGQPAEVWRNRNLRNEMGSSVYWQGKVYGYDFRQLRCLDWRTGNVVWSADESRLGTVILADGKVIGLEETGQLVVAEATPEACRVIAKAPILGGRCWSAPALADGRLFVRNAAGEAVCLDLRPPPAP